MHHELRTEIDIEALPEAVWRILTDLDAYQDWNPFITSSAGTVAVGRTLVNRFEPPGGRAVTLKPKVTAVEGERVIEWLGHLGLPGLLDGRHRFELQRTASGTRVVQHERFDGVLVRLFRRSIDTRTRAGFEAMDQALKARAESISAV